MTGELLPRPTDDGFIVDERGRRWVTMSNGLTRAAHGLTLGEKRLIALAITKLDSRKGTNDGLKTRIHASEYAETFGVDEATAYQQLKLAGKALYNRSIVFYTPAYKRNGTPLEPTEHRMRWVGRASYAKGEGWIELAWWHEVLPHITGLAKQFKWKRIVVIRPTTIRPTIFGQGPTSQTCGNRGGCRCRRRVQRFWPT